MRLNYRYLKEARQLEPVLAQLQTMPILAVDTETTGLDPFEDRLVLLQIGDPQRQFIIDCRTVSLEPLRPILESNRPKVLHNAKFDYKMLKAASGIEMANMVDTMLVEQVLTNGLARRSFALSELAESYLALPLDKSKRRSFIDHTGDFSQAQLEYAARDILVTYLVATEQLPHIKEKGLAHTVQLECLAIPSFGDLELNGIFLDRQRWTALIEEARARRDRAKEELDKHFAAPGQVDLFGRPEINYESEQQLKDALYRIGVVVSDTQKNTLLKVKHPVIEHIFEYREQQKVVSTYGEGFIKHIHPKTGRIHPDFRQLGAESGRVSCSKPNLQNIPRDSEFRSCFTAPPGRKIVTADYSGCELRILAELSQDPAFIEAFRKNEDLHAMVARRMFRVPVSKQENRELRDRAKVINFGLAYGMGAQALAATLGTSAREAESLLHDYFHMFPRIKEYLDSSARLALERGWAETIGGRKRYFEVSDELPASERAALERQAKNMPIQGTNADMLKLALVLVRDRIKSARLDALLVNTVHDEIVIECAEQAAEATAALVRDCMIEAGEYYLKSVPVEVECRIADAWAK